MYIDPELKIYIISNLRRCLVHRIINLNLFTKYIIGRSEARFTVRQMGSDRVPFLLEAAEGQKRHRLFHRVIPLFIMWTVLAVIDVMAVRNKSDFSTILQRSVTV